MKTVSALGLWLVMFSQISGKVRISKKKYTSGLLVRRGLLGAVRVKLIEVYLVAIMGL